MSETQTTGRQIILAPGQSDQMIPVAIHGSSPLSGLHLRAGDKPLNVVADDSDDDGVGESLAESLVERGLAVYIEQPAATGGIVPPSAPVIVGEAASPSIAAIPPPPTQSPDAMIETEAEVEQTHLNNATSPEASVAHEDVPE